MIPRRLFLIGASSLAVSACGGNLLGLGPQEPGAIYPLRPVFTPGEGAKVAWALSILRPDLAGGLDSDRIVLHQPDGTMDFYAKATYPDRLGAIVQQALLDGFEMSGRIAAVAPEQAALHADYNLVSEVKDFSAHYAQVDGVPSVTVSMTAKLTTAHGRAIVASFSTSQTVNASANSAGAAAQALRQALGTVVTQIVNWALTAPMPATQQPVATTSPGKPAEQLLHDASRGAGRLRPP
ncbi:MAG TPA: ABC-type transport auxiliary lipoprotein family protein [Rhizomicrobium sp.]|jgi:cholesterol transport system auxiliary component|nr:ABC-type transport auxiliary lipoprotein family protein [Rhizomicrobium sp.]